MGRRYRHSGDSTYYNDWVEKAEDDLLAAELLIGDDELYAPCAFHCHQCVEKILKAYLLYKQKHGIDGHNLPWLCRQAVKCDDRFDQWLDECAALNHYYIETRYPSDFAPVLTETTVRAAIAMARAVFEHVCDELDV